MHGVQDHFSRQARTYAKARPHYPAALFAWLAAVAPRTGCAWDAGCGNGQAALALAEHFDRVVATDTSRAQLGEAPPHPRIDYRCEPAETPSLVDRSVDLVTVAQAFHWFDPAFFHAAVQRVLHGDGVIAVWTYDLCRVEASVDTLLRRLYSEVLGPHWPAERAHVESGYRSLPFPYRAVPAPAMAMTHEWTLPQLLDYLRSWSASERHRQATGEDAVAAFAPAFERAWGAPARVRTVQWPLRIRAGRLR